jgi:PII-like signaling protein
LATEGLDEYFFLHGMLLSADALTSGSPVYRKSQYGPEKRVRAAVRAGAPVLRGIRTFPTLNTVQSVTLLNLEFSLPAVIFKVADLTRRSFSL